MVCNAAQNSSDNLFSYPLGHHHGSEVVYLSRVGSMVTWYGSKK